MSRTKIEVIDTGNIGIYADFGIDSEDDVWAIKKQEIMKKLETLYSPDDEELDEFWKKVIDRMKEAEGLNGMTIQSFVRFDIMKKIYENLTDRKKTSLIVERNSTVMENSTL